MKLTTKLNKQDFIDDVTKAFDRHYKNQDKLDAYECVAFLSATLHMFFYKIVDKRLALSMAKEILTNMVNDLEERANLDEGTLQ